ncbi:hypothetical protein MHYP_G00106210 [Metynnis hypsauchen]
MGQHVWWDRSVKMSSVKEECEDVSVMEASGLKTEDEEMDSVLEASGLKTEDEEMDSVLEASGLKTEDEEMDRGTFVREDIKEEFKLEVEPFEEECAAQKTDQTTQHERSSIFTPDASMMLMSSHSSLTQDIFTDLLCKTRCAVVHRPGQNSQ